MLMPWNASEEEIEAWAWQAEADEPTEDWDLAITVESNASLVLRLASNESCPHRWFFLRCLYLFVGDAVRTGFRAFPHELIDKLISSVTDQSPPYVRRWASRARALVDSRSTDVDYADWCGGRLASVEQLHAG
jgi:hypothetical protein